MSQVKRTAVSGPDAIRLDALNRQLAAKRAGVARLEEQLEGYRQALKKDETVLQGQLTKLALDLELDPARSTFDYNTMRFTTEIDE